MMEQTKQQEAEKQQVEGVAALNIQQDSTDDASIMPPSKEQQPAAEEAPQHGAVAVSARRSLTLDLELRPVKEADTAEQLLPLLEQLSTVGDVPPQFFKVRQEAVLQDENTIMVVIEDLRAKKLVGCGTILVEPKFIHAGGFVAHLEDLVIERGLRSKGLGSWIVNSLMKVAEERGCYKMLVDCSEENVPFYKKNNFKHKGTCMTLYFPETAASGQLRHIQVAPEDFRDEFVVRQLHIDDIKKGYLELLAQLTVVGNVPADVCARRIAQAERNNCFFIVIEHKEKGQIVGAGTLLVEQKFIRSAGFAGHLEDVVVDAAIRGKGLGTKIISYLTELARKVGCYKCILDCDDHNVPFYEYCGYSKGHSPAFMAKYFE
ncbi:hypothetical protein PTSG_06202 [Salpingoeca rosetta]|uniref:Glucosamine 6-phosphate N-acetyltransferase n=1 Tax=Salpingoeca rosetta (strain ATCC 50818 / BSB-021) TaxID=946362 RepID=F2UC85_SALR5|nr:uncharacterized protein PTSG_06202 [Salpingoeca rosetta]EGD74192.1 hypothetical protein PTSG_06202 [Salpingoeca rosetta]|eukprot:XP_004993092.1 hypothetical protein PTSG_06202 [Salpingoeca rosetta]